MAMISPIGKKLKEIIDMDITIIKHPGSDLIELWINNVFICQGQNIYINHHIEDQAHVETYFPEDDIQLNTDPCSTDPEDLPFN